MNRWSLRAALWVLLATTSCAKCQRRDEHAVPLTEDAAPFAHAEAPLKIPAARTLALGTRHSCALENTRAWCWGDNRHGQLGDGTTTSRSTPGEVRGLTDVVEIVAKGDLSCARTTSGTIHCWGFSEAPAIDTAIPKKLALPAATLLRMSPTAICIRAVDGRGSCLNDPSLLAPSNEPISVVTNTAIVDFALLSSTACALLSTGRVVCWGDPRWGQIPTPDHREVIFREPFDIGLSDVDWIAGGGYGAFCAHRPTGIACWGMAYHLHAFTGAPPDTTPWLAPRSLPLLDSFTHVDFMNGAMCAWDDARLVCDHPEWHADLTLPGLIEASFGGLHACARQDHDGQKTISCWGQNESGQTGDPAPVAHDDPRRVVF